MTAMEPWRRVTGGIGGTVPVTAIDVPPEMRAHGMESAREVVLDRATMVVTTWSDGLTIVGAFCGGGSPDAARAKALQRALENGLRLKARWVAQRSEVENG